MDNPREYAQEAYKEAFENIPHVNPFTMTMALNEQQHNSYMRLLGAMMSERAAASELLTAEKYGADQGTIEKLTEELKVAQERTNDAAKEAEEKLYGGKGFTEKYLTPAREKIDKGVEELREINGREDVSQNISGINDRENPAPTNWFEQQAQRAESITNLRIELAASLKEEQILENALNEAVKNGADKDVVGQIIDEWKEAHQNTVETAQELSALQGRSLKTNDLHNALYKGVGEFQQGMISNLREGMRTVTDGAMDLVGKVKDGLITPGVLGQNLKTLSENTINAVQEKMEQVKGVVKEQIDGIKDKITEMGDMKLVDDYAKAVDRAEAFNNTPMGQHLKEVNDRRDEALEAINGQKEKALADAKEVIDGGKLTRSEQFKVGVGTISDALMGKEGRDRMAEMTSPEGKAARMEIAENEINRIADTKSNIVNIGADMANRTQNPLGYAAHEKLQDDLGKAKNGLEGIRSDSVKDLIDRANKIKEEAGGTMREAITAAKMQPAPAGPGM